MKLKSFITIFVLFALSAALVGCTTVKKQFFNDGMVSAKSVHAYLDMPSSVELTQQTVQKAARDAFPPSMAEYQVYLYMQNHHVSASAQTASAYYIPKDAQGDVLFVVSYNPEPHSIVTYRITLTIVDKLVKEVKVDESMKSI